MSEAYEKPIPVPDRLSQPFWDGTAAGELRLQRCRACGHWQFYPRGWCTACASLDLAWERASGRGEVYSFTVIRRHTAPWWVRELPYVVAVVQLEEGPRLMTNLVGGDPESVRIGQPVAFEPVPAADGVVLPLFKPA
jgi:uncharacterized protein